MRVMSVESVLQLLAAVRSEEPRTRAQAWLSARFAAEELRQLGEKELVLAPEVRLPVAAVVLLLWRLHRTAVDQWRSATAEARGLLEQQLQFNLEQDPYLLEFEAQLKKHDWGFVDDLDNLSRWQRGLAQRRELVLQLDLLHAAGLGEEADALIEALAPPERSFVTAARIGRVARRNAAACVPDVQR